MIKDRLQLIKFAFVLVLLIAGWFGLMFISDSFVVRVLLGWAGFAVVAITYRRLLRSKIYPPES